MNPSTKYFLYLLQGRKRNVLQYAYLQNETSDLIALTFDQAITDQELPCLAHIFFPNSTWAEGRNKQLEKAKALEQSYRYYIFIDDDVDFIQGSFLDFQQRLLDHQPAVGVPLLTVIKNSNRYNPRLKVQHPVAVDQQVQAYHHSVLMNTPVMPLVTQFDPMSWWYSCEINGFLLLSLYRGYLMQFNDIVVENTGHHFDTETHLSTDPSSNYIGGITQQGLEEVKKFIEKRYGAQPKLRNSLFHDPAFPRYNYLKRGAELRVHLLRLLGKGRLGECWALLRLMWSNSLKKYPAHWLIEEQRYQKIDDGLLSKIKQVYG